MKKIRLFTMLLLLSAGMLVFNSCQKEEEIIVPQEKMASQNILKFSSSEEFETILDSVSNMTDDQRGLWEKKKNFKSFRTKCDELFFSINFDSIKTIEELKALDPKGKYINIYTKLGETYFEPMEIASNEGSLINDDKMVIVGSRIYKLINSEFISTDTTNTNELIGINSLSDALAKPELFSTPPKGLKSIFYEDISDEVVSSDNEYKIYARIQTENYWRSFPTSTDMETEIWIKNYKKGALGWYVKKILTSIEVDVVSYESSTGTYDYIVDAKNEEIGSYHNPSYLYLSDVWSNSFNPQFYSYIVKANTSYLSLIL